MSVTLEVSKLSGWLNAFVFCRESKGGHAVRDNVRAGRRTQRVRELGIDCIFGAGHGEERTPNMPFMFVTLEVSKLSGWLNADAYCRESKGGHTVRGEVCREGDGGARSVVRGRARLHIRGRAREGAHPEHVVHVRDAGGVEAQRLVERRRILPRVERGAYDAGQGSGREAGGGGRPRCT